MAPRIVTIAERPDLDERLGEVADPWPEFIHHDDTVNSFWPELYVDFREFQLALVDEETDEVLGKGCTLPVEWDGRVETLPGGVVDVCERSFAAPNVLCALVAIVDARQQGRGLSGLIIGGRTASRSIRGSGCTTGSAPTCSRWRRARSTCAGASPNGRSGRAWPSRRRANTSSRGRSCR